MELTVAFSVLGHNKSFASVTAQSYADFLAFIASLQ
jgi:hypothetical protein